MYIWAFFILIIANIECFYPSTCFFHGNENMLMASYKDQRSTRQKKDKTFWLI